MIEVHGEAFSGQYKWQFRAPPPSTTTEDVVRLSLGTSDFARISERDAFERVRSALRYANIDWIQPTFDDWTLKLEGLHKVIGTRASIPWLNGTLVAKPEFSSDHQTVSGTQVGTAEFVFYITRDVALRRNSVTDTSARNTVFISYSHSDKKWVDRLSVHLKPLQRQGRLNLFDDTKIQPGADWRKEIKAALEKAKVAVLLISADFLASDFIAEDELPPLLEKAEAGGARIIPLIVSPSRFTKTEALAKYQAANDPKIPLEGMEYRDREELLVRVADAVIEALDHIANTQTRSKPESKSNPEGSIPYAILVPGKPNLVCSPYMPDKYFDVSGHRRGSEVVDPYTGKPCLVP